MAHTQQFIFDNNNCTLIKMRHSFCETKSPDDSNPPSKSDTFIKSDINIIRAKKFPSVIDSGCVNRYCSPLKDSSSEYYKKYEYDEVPVRDNRNLSNNLNNNIASSDAQELTNSDLDKLEMRIFQNMSIELQTDESSTDTHECNIRLFKTTVQEILDRFYCDVDDFQVYKKKFHDLLLSQNNDNIVDEIEDFIKKMIQDIVSSDSCSLSDINAPKLSSSETETEYTFGNDSRTFSLETRNSERRTQKIVEAYRNENYLTDSTLEDETAKISFAVKRLQRTTYMAPEEHQNTDKIIPLKISYAQKDIHSGNSRDEMDVNNKSIFCKICNFLCKKIRKTSVGWL